MIWPRYHGPSYWTFYNPTPLAKPAFIVSPVTLAQLSATPTMRRRPLADSSPRVPLLWLLPRPNLSTPHRRPRRDPLMEELQSRKIRIHPLRAFDSPKRSNLHFRIPTSSSNNLLWPESTPLRSYITIHHDINGNWTTEQAFTM